VKYPVHPAITTYRLLLLEFRLNQNVRYRRLRYLPIQSLRRQT
jgi:hypothetical protein